MTAQSQQKEIVLLTAAITGLQQNYPKATFTFGGEAFKTADLVTLFQSAIKALAAATAAKTAASDAIATAHEATEKAMAAYADLVDFIKLSAGSTSTALVAFGQKPKARKVPTVEVKAAAKQKRAATRAAKKPQAPAQPPAEEANVAPAATTPSTTTIKS
jgi:hypothetical protein